MFNLETKNIFCHQEVEFYEEIVGQLGPQNLNLSLQVEQKSLICL